AKNTPLNNLPLTFAILQGSGKIIGEPHQTTNSAGEAAISFQLGEKSGRCVVKVSSEQLWGTAMFTLYAQPETAVRIRIAGGNQQTGIAGHRLNQTIQVQTLDRFSNGVPDVAVAFTTQSGHGIIFPQSAMLTDSTGVVQAEWTLGLDSGEQFAFAESEGLSPSPLIFKAIALANQAPQLFLPDSLKIAENHQLKLSITVSDAENDSIFITGVNLPDGSMLDPQKKIFSWTPDYTQAGRYAPVFYAVDSYNARSLKVVPIIVSNTNRPPMIREEDSRPLEHQLGKLRTPATLDFFVAATDLDHDPLKYLWKVNNRLMTTSPTFRLQTQTIRPGKTTVQAFVYDQEDTARTTWDVEIVTSVELSAFSAQFIAFRGGVITWSTRNEWNQVGFYVERSEREDGRYEMISPLISPSPSHTYEFWDPQVEAGSSCFYRLVSVSSDGAVAAHESVRLDIPLPSAFVLHQNYPNPFNAGTTLTFELPQSSSVQICIYDLLGRRVKVLQDAMLQAGYHRLLWDGCDETGSMTASGIYYAVVSNGPDRVICKMMQLR
ncbi:MAG: T9SS C-terminal target domain-containing protein, partial [Calditrichaeota bacterium]